MVPSTNVMIFGKKLVKKLLVVAERFDFYSGTGSGLEFMKIIFIQLEGGVNTT